MSMERMRAQWRLVAIAAFALASFACANAGGGGGGDASAATADAKPAAAKQAASDTPIPAGHPLAKVEKGMSDDQVVAILGQPDHQNAYVTAKAFLPWNYSPDTSRSDFIYKGKGRVVFSRNAYSGRLKVIRVIYNPNEMK
ncbi:MAG: hypothetical protein R3E88_01305 [Myxococcota bacterium]|nr:hypothetical protein [Myxococcales bacterium]